MPEAGAGSTDLMLVKIMILRSDVVEKVCRVGCGTLDNVYARVTTGRYLGTLQNDESPVCWSLNSDIPMCAATCWLNSCQATVSWSGVFSYILRDSFRYATQIIGLGATSHGLYRLLSWPKYELEQNQDRQSG